MSVWQFLVKKKKKDEEEETNKQTSHSRLALHPVLFADEATVLEHKLLKPTSSQETHLKGISFSIENSLFPSLLGGLFSFIYSRP